MKTSQLKNIVIFILFLFNAFLLILLSSQNLQQRNVQKHSAEQLQLLFEASGIALDSHILSVDSHILNYSAMADNSVRDKFVSALLGKATASEASNSVTYESAKGRIQFRANSSIEAEFSDYTVEAPLSFCEKLLKPYGYTVLASNRAEAENTGSSGSGSIVATRCTDCGTIYNAALVFNFDDGSLVSLNGIFLSALSAGSEQEGINATTALVNFLDYYNAGGLVCTAVTDLQCGYYLKSFSSAQAELVPVWYIETDVISYYVDYETGNVFRV